MTSIKFYSVNERSLPIRVGNKNRDWFAQDLYYKVDITSANEAGWEFRCPVNFTIEWNGGKRSDDLLIYTTADNAGYFYTGLGNGICSIHTGYVIQTPKDYGVLLTSFPNYYKENVHTMTSLVESDWVHFPYLINLKMLTPGKVEYKKGEPLGFATVVPYKQMENFECEVDTIMRNEELMSKYNDWLDGKPQALSFSNVQVRKPKSSVDILKQKIYNIFR